MRHYKNKKEMAFTLEALGRSQAVIEFLPDGTILDANENFLNALGYSLKEIQGNHHSMFAEPELAASNEYKVFWKKLAQGEFQAGQFKRLKKGGAEIWIEASYNPILDKSGKVIKVVKYATDITKRSLELAELQGLVAAISRAQAVIHFELDGTILDANENFLSVMGYSLDEIKGRHHSMFAEAGVADTQEYKEFWKSLASGEFQVGSYKRIGKGGKEVWIEASYNPIFDPSGKPFKVTKFATDITPRKEANLQLANDFETNVHSLVQEVASSSSQMQGSAQELTMAADKTGQQAGAVAAATEQLAASGNEISSQITHSVQIVNEAVSEAKQSEVLVAELVEATSKIGEVTSLISDIASQTNLLALNATIEAARAGEAGKGFAVVASEVKNLAAETTNATDEISSQISSVQQVSQATAEVIQKIIQVISNVNEASTAISGAVEEQSAATQEVSMNINGVQQAAGETGQASATMFDVAQNLTTLSGDLQERVNQFLKNVRSM